MRAYSSYLRERVLADSDARMSTNGVAAKYRVSATRARRLKHRRRESGSFAPLPQRHGKAPKWLPHAGRIAEAVRTAPDATLEGHRRRFDTGLSTTTLWRAIKGLGLTVEKKS